MNVRDEALKFFNTFYGAQIMTLAIMSNSMCQHWISTERNKYCDSTQLNSIYAPWYEKMKCKQNSLLLKMLESSSVEKMNETNERKYKQKQKKRCWTSKTIQKQKEYARYLRNTRNDIWQAKPKSKPNKERNAKEKFDEQKQNLLSFISSIWRELFWKRTHV